MPEIRNFSAVILAGGESKRMGGLDKAGLIVNGMPILQKSIQVLKELFSEILIVTNEKRCYFFDGVTVVRDIIKGAGPLGGIHTGLSCMKNEAGFFAACDMPFLSGELIRRLLKDFEHRDCDAIVPRRNGRIEPLHAVYKECLKDKLSYFLSHNGRDYSIRSFLKSIDVHYLDLMDNDEFQDSFENINTSGDFAKI
ncbi:MAG: molybdenum cofactor guanylyltransferase [Candidatus Omnitrophota bacterium]